MANKELSLRLHLPNGYAALESAADYIAAGCMVADNHTAGNLAVDSQIADSLAADSQAVDSLDFDYTDYP